MSTKYETKVSLPSNGRLYDEEIPKEFTLRAMTTGEEKLLLGSTSTEDVFDKILQKCIVEPKNVNLKKLIAADKHYLIMKLRIHTYGSEYTIELNCPHCGSKQEVTLNLDDFIVNELTDDFVEPIEFKLPMSEDEISCKLLRDSDLDFIRKQSKKIAKSTNTSRSELEYTMRMAKHITQINGEDIEFGEAQKYVQDMHGRDSAYFWFKLNEVLLGYDTSIEVECDSCGGEIEDVMPITSEFFRPKFR